MLQYKLTHHRHAPGFEVRAIIMIVKLGGQQEEVVEELTKLRNKIEQSLPGMWRAKCNVTNEELIITARTELASEAQSIQFKLEDIIKGAAKTLNLL